MEKLTSKAKYEIKGRGTVFAVESPQEYPRDKCPLIGQHVEIDGTQYLVKGVESFALGTIRKGAEIGLLVDSPPPNEE